MLWKKLSVGNVAHVIGQRCEFNQFTWQWYGVSPVWRRWCTVRLPRNAKLLSHTLHLCFFTPECTSKWPFKWPICKESNRCKKHRKKLKRKITCRNCAKQMLHLYGFSPEKFHLQFQCSVLYTTKLLFSFPSMKMKRSSHLWNVNFAMVLTTDRYGRECDSAATVWMRIAFDNVDSWNSEVR